MSIGCSGIGVKVCLYFLSRLRMRLASLREGAFASAYRRINGPVQSECQVLDEWVQEHVLGRDRQDDDFLATFRE